MHGDGLAMSDNDSSMQQDFLHGWAPTEWLAIRGLAEYSYKKDAQRISKEFT
ncbi:MAG: trehalase family glycosidase [Acidobacteriaceae bacterium]